MTPPATRLLFVCSRARRRSATAEAIFGDVPGFEALAAGTAPDADVPLDADLIAWADVIFPMEAAHRARLTRRFGRHLRGKRVVVLGIADDHEAMDPALVRLLRARVGRSLPGVAAAASRTAGEA